MWCRESLYKGVGMSRRQYNLSRTEVDDIDSVRDVSPAYFHLPGFVHEDEPRLLDDLAIELARLDIRQSRGRDAVAQSFIETQPGPLRQAWGTPPASPRVDRRAERVITRQPSATSMSATEGRVRGIFREILGIYPGCFDMLKGIASAIISVDALESIVGSFEGMLSSPFSYDGAVGQTSSTASGGVGAGVGFGIQCGISSLHAFIHSRRSMNDEDTCLKYFMEQVPEVITGVVSGFVTGVVSYILDNSASLNLSPNRAFMYSGFVGIATYFVFRIVLRLLLNQFRLTRSRGMGGTWSELFGGTPLVKLMDVVVAVAVVVVVSSLAVTSPIATLGAAVKVAGCEIAFNSLFTTVLEANVSCLQLLYCCDADKRCYFTCGSCFSFVKRWAGIGPQASNYGFCAALLDCVMKLRDESDEDLVRPF